MSDPKYVLANGWICADTGGHTCGAGGSEFGGIHEPGRGLEPLVEVERALSAVAEVDRRLHAAKVERVALRRALSDLLDDQPLRCRFHGDRFDFLGMTGGRPNCESCRVPYFATRAAALLTGGDQ